jgi:hypothetical protein
VAEIPQTTPATARAIFAALESKQRRDLHPRLAASGLGGCERQQWDKFRWLFPAEIFDAQKLSIFETGEHWETRLVQRLRDAGMIVDDVDPETGEQWRIVFAGGHASGRTDGKVMGVPEAPKTMHVFEAKSHNDRSFKALLKAANDPKLDGGVKHGKPEHYAQVQAYMHCQGLTRALYLAVCKNDDALYAERIPYDPVFAIGLINKAERIVTSDRRPACSCPVYFLKAGYGCAPNDGLMPQRNCRSCLHSTAHLDGDARWSCARWSRDLTLDEQRVGCPQHLFNPTAVPGEQTDVDFENERITYRLPTGDVWVDGGAK